MQETRAEYKRDQDGIKLGPITHANPPWETVLFGTLTVMCRCGHSRDVHEDGRCGGYAVNPEPIPGSRGSDGWPLDWTAGEPCGCVAVVGR